ncbi:hypothetical protein D3C86_1802800 [compost metagenome]
MVFDQHAAGVGVADVQNHVHVDRGLLQRSRDDLYLRHRQLVAEHVQHVKVVRLIFESFQPGVDLSFGTLFQRGGAFGKDFAQPAVHPGQIEKLAQIVIAVGQREA